MNKNPEIIIDINGSDKGPSNIIYGASLALNKHKDINIIFVGKKSVILEEVTKLNIDLERISIIDTDEEITNNDNIYEAFYRKEKASILLGIKELAENDNTIGLISCGNSGAIIMGAIKYLREDETYRPCIASVLPTANHQYTCLVDSGSTVDCSSRQLHYFALQGVDLMKHLFKIESPTVGLVSIGEEATKGNKVTKETYEILKEDERINFVGNIEGNKALSGVVDVLVADGFVANQILKVTEGTAIRMLKDIYKYIKDNNRMDMLPLVDHLKNTYDFVSLGGAIVLGAKKTVIKCHGASNETTIINTVNMLVNLFNNRHLYE